MGVVSTAQALTVGHGVRKKDVHLGLIGKRVADFLLVLIELFSLGRTAEALRTKNISKIGDFTPTRSL